VWARGAGGKGSEEHTAAVKAAVMTAVAEEMAEASRATAVTAVVVRAVEVRAKEAMSGELKVVGATVGVRMVGVARVEGLMGSAERVEEAKVPGTTVVAAKEAEMAVGADDSAARMVARQGSAMRVVATEEVADWGMAAVVQEASAMVVVVTLVVTKQVARTRGVGMAVPVAEEVELMVEAAQASDVVAAEIAVARRVQEGTAEKALKERVVQQVASKVVGVGVKGARVWLEAH